MQVSLNELRKECFLHNGKAFDVRDREFIIIYSASAERKAFGYRWSFSLHSSDDWSKVDKYEKDEMIKRLPKGITYSRLGAKPGELYKTLEKPHKGDYISSVFQRVYFVLHVSDKYSAAKLATAEGKRTFFFEELKPEMLKQVKEFKEKVLNAHLKIVEDAYAYTLKMNYKGMVYSDGIFTTDSDGFRYGGGISFSQYGLKNLSELYQIYGFTMAMTEYGIKDLGSNQWYCIHPFCEWDGSVRISIVGDTGVPTESVSKADW